VVQANPGGRGESGWQERLRVAKSKVGWEKHNLAVIAISAGSLHFFGAWIDVPQHYKPELGLNFCRPRSRKTSARLVYAQKSDDSAVV